jgi:hypothetical protein
MSASPPFLPYGKQVIDDDDIAAVAETLRSDFLTTGPVVEAFEQRLREITGAEHALAVANGTAALHLAAMALDLGPGDLAVVPTMTFLATANAARYVGADVVFADVDPRTGLLMPEPWLRHSNAAASGCGRYSRFISMARPPTCRRSGKFPAPGTWPSSKTPATPSAAFRRHRPARRRPSAAVATAPCRSFLSIR